MLGWRNSIQRNVNAQTWNKMLWSLICHCVIHGCVFSWRCGMLIVNPHNNHKFLSFLFGFSTTSSSGSVYIAIQHCALNEFALTLAVTLMST